MYDALRMFSRFIIVLPFGLFEVDVWKYKIFCLFVAVVEPVVVNEVPRSINFLWSFDYLLTFFIRIEGDFGARKEGSVFRLEFYL